MEPKNNNAVPAGQFHPAIGLNDKPALGPLLLYALQWWVVSLPCVVIMGLIVARLQGLDLAEQVFSMQKLFALVGAVTVIQVLWGHRLPLVVGPASTLLVGIVASSAAGPMAMYTAICFGGGVLALASFSGLLSHTRRFFTPRIVSVILILIAFTLAPSILDLIFAGQGKQVARLIFALAMVLGMVVLNFLLKGAAKSLTVFLGSALGIGAYALVFGLDPLPELKAGGGALFIAAAHLDAGTVLSFLFCFLALTINELGSVESIGHMLRADDMTGRVKRGAGFQGLANMAAGAMGIIGPVDFSLSAGLISSTGCASRFTLVPAGIGLMACALAPNLVLLLCVIPATVMGALMLYLMATQLASGLSMLVSERGIDDFSSGLTVALPLMIGLIIAFAPQSAFAELPALLRPIVGNGFVMGTITVIFMEHV
ncbi:purine/pyrimidine permease [Desulfovibrio sp. OttesenSCG-928-M14]|nr:purine/pyrimidine permease [Desulfovibrio sp. OttesenSCG-928-M14]